MVVAIQNGIELNLDRMEEVFDSVVQEVRDAEITAEIINGNMCELIK